MSSLCFFLPFHLGYIASFFFHMYSSNADALFGRNTKVSFSSFFYSTVLFSEIREHLQGEAKSGTLPEWRLAQLCYVLWPMVKLSMRYEWAHTQEHTHTEHIQTCLQSSPHKSAQTDTKSAHGNTSRSGNSVLLFSLADHVGSVLWGEHLVHVCAAWIFLASGLRHPIFPITAPRSQSSTVLDLNIQDTLNSSSSYSLVHTHISHSEKLRNETWLKCRIDYGDLVQGIARSTST